MKRIFSSILFSVLMVLLWAIPSAALSQEPCEISCDAEMPVCNGTKVKLSVPYNDLYVYSWTPGNYTTNSITVKPLSTTTYHVYVTDTAGMAVCDNSFTVDVLPGYHTRMCQLQLTCSNNEADNGRTAQVKVIASEGEPPYTYQWEEGFGVGRWDPLSPMHISPSDPSVAIGLKGYRWYRVKVVDSRGCAQYDSIYTRAFLAPVIRIHCDPDSSVYLQKPDITFSFENLSIDTLKVDHFFWTFENGITSTRDNPTFTYVETGDFYPTLTVYDDLHDCDTVYLMSVHVDPVKLKIPSVFTPNGDGVNDTFVISLASASDTPGDDSGSRKASADEEPINTYYKSTELVIFNRWGRIVYQSTDYQNDWDGGGLSDGTYFYVLRCKGLKEEIQYQGSVMILTKSRQ